MCLFAIYMSSFEKFLFRSSAHLLIGVFGFLILSFLSCLYIWRLIPCHVLHLKVVSLILRVVFPSRLWFPFVQKLVYLFILIPLGLHCSAWGFSSYGYVGCSVMSDSLWPPWTVAPQAPLEWGNFSGKNTGVGCHSLLQGIFQPGDWNRVSCIAGVFFTDWATKEAQKFQYNEVLGPKTKVWQMNVHFYIMLKWNLCKTPYLHVYVCIIWVPLKGLS